MPYILGNKFNYFKNHLNYKRIIIYFLVIIFKMELVDGIN